MEFRREILCYVLNNWEQYLQFMYKFWKYIPRSKDHSLKFIINFVSDIVINSKNKFPWKFFGTQYCKKKWKRAFGSLATSKNEYVSNFKFHFLKLFFKVFNNILPKN